MTLFSNKSIKWLMLAGLLGFVFSWSSASLAAKNKISVSVNVSKSLKEKYHPYAIGFSVGGKGYGTLGSHYSGKGPVGADYSFGFRARGYGDVSCGSSKLTRDSMVVLYYKGNKCMHQVSAK